MPAFDRVAAEYDKVFTDTLIGKSQRQRVWKFLSEDLSGKLKILEINCGTGEDAILLARIGNDVTGTDASAEMINIAKTKLSGDINCRFEPASFSELATKYPPGSFELIFSDFGGLNCAGPEELKQLDHTFHQLLKPGGKMIVVLMGIDCLMERIYAFSRGKQSELNRRKSPQQIRLDEQSFQETWFYHSSTLQNHFSSFRLIKKRPVGLFIPPSYLEPWLKRNNFALKPLLALERIFSNFSVCANKGDHIYLVWEKK